MDERLEVGKRPATVWIRRVVSCLIFGLAAASLGCADLMPLRPTMSGQLHDYSGLIKDRFHLNDGLGSQRNLSRNAGLARLDPVDSFYIEPTVWRVDEQSRAGRDPTCRLVLTAELERALCEKLGKIRPLVDRPGPNTAHVRSFITETRLSRPFLNTAFTVAGVAGMAGGVPIPLGPMFSGGACVEAEVMLPRGQQLAAISCASGGGPLDFSGQFIRDGHARKAMRRAAKELEEAIVQP